MLNLNLSELFKNYRTVFIILGGLLLILLGAGIGSKISQNKNNIKLNELIAALADKDAQVEVVKNKNTTLENLIKASPNQPDIINVVSKIPNTVVKTEYVVQTKTVLVPVEPTVALPALPSEYSFRLANNIEVAHFGVTGTQSAPEYSFETRSLSFKSTLALSEKTSAISLKMSSSADPETWIDVPVDLTVNHIPAEHKVLRPYANLGLTVSTNISAPIKPDLTASLSMSWLHPIPCMDLLNPRISANTSNIKFGVDALNYNIGCHINGLSDLWIGAGASVNTKTIPSIDLTFGTRL